MFRGGGVYHRGVPREPRADPVPRRPSPSTALPDAPKIVGEISVERTLNAAAVEQLRRAAILREIED